MNYHNFNNNNGYLLSSSNIQGPKRRRNRNNNNDFIKTKKKRVRYEFVSRKDVEEQNNNYAGQMTDYYQICAFRNPKNDKFHMRKFVLDEKDNIMSVREYYLSERKCKQFFKTKNEHQYRCYPSYDLDNVNYPVMGDILAAKSPLLANNYGI